MPMIKITDTAHRALTKATNDPIVGIDNDVQQPDGSWLIKLSWTSINRLRCHQLPDETYSEVIERHCKTWEPVKSERSLDGLRALKSALGEDDAL